MNFTYVGELEFGGSKIKVNLPALGPVDNHLEAISAATRFQQAA